MRNALGLIGLGTVLSACILLVQVRADTPTTQPDKSKPITMIGSFAWNGGGPKDNKLTVVMTPTKPNEWSAVYTFKWGGSDNTYTGVIKADPKTGQVTGTGAPAGNGRKFSFKGADKNGVINFDHFEDTGGKTVATGKGWMKPQ